MKILIVEDDAHKSSQIFELINSESDPRPEIIIHDNVRDAVKFINDIIPNKIILDMSLPSHKPLPGQGTPVSLPTGGIEVLFELKKKRLINLPILILTQYPEIEIEGEPIPIHDSAEVFKSEYGFKDIEACYYDIDGKQWKINTTIFLRK